MSKRGINIILLLISIGILFFIFNAFYGAFTRTPQAPSTEPEPSSSTANTTVISGEIVGNTETPAPEVVDQNSSNEEAGKLLQENPALRQALPPVPEAPASTQSKETDNVAVETTSSSNSEVATDSSSEAATNTTSIETSTTSTSTEPVGVVSSPKPAAPFKNANDIVLPLNTGKSTTQTGANDSFPKPVSNNERSATSNNSFPKPSKIDSDTNNNFPAPIN